MDEHLVAPGAGFDWHAHRGVDIVSVVLAGALRHEDVGGEVIVVQPGTSSCNRPGVASGTARRTPRPTAPLRFVQVTVLGEGAAPARLVRPPVRLGAASVDVVAAGGGDSADDLADGDFETGDDRFVLALAAGGRLVIRVGS